MSTSGARGSYPEEFAALARSFAEAGGVSPTLHQIVATSLEVVPCDWSAAAMTDHLSDRPARMVAMTDAELMSTVAKISVGRDSPGRTAFSTGSMVHCDDLTTTTQWCDYARAMVQETPIRSVLSFGLQLHGDTLGVLTFYSGRPGGFDEAAQRRGRLLADHATVAIGSAASADAADSLRDALNTSRVIGAAIGVLAERHSITTDQAFDLLRVVSNNANRRLADVADDFMRTGELPEP